MANFFLISLFLLTSLFGDSLDVDSTKIRNPKIAWKLSFIPGLGQVYNGKFLKSSCFILGQTYAYYKRKQYIESGEVGKRNTYGWWIFGLYVWGILDAYVDAQLSTFPLESSSNTVNKKET